MEVFVQQLINGITLGSIYGLIAIGYTMVFGIIGMVNFAHGDVFMVSAFIALITLLLLTTWLGIGSFVIALFVVLIVAMLFTSLVNWAIERIAYRPLRGSFRLAPLLGIDVDRTVSITFVIAAALAAVAGTMYLMYYGVVSFADGFVPGVKAFTAAVLGGIGSLPGAVIGGLLIGLIETMWSAYFSIDYKDVAAFSVLAITMIFLPQGILGRPDVEKV